MLRPVQAGVKVGGHARLEMNGKKRPNRANGVGVERSGPIGETSQALNFSILAPSHFTSQGAKASVSRSVREL